MNPSDKVNILLVDDQPGKLLSYQAMLGELDENLIKAQSAKEALEILLKNDVAVLLMDVCMPELDGFQLAEMIREHPRFTKTAIIFISAIQVEEVDHLRGYQMGAVDYVPVPVIPEILRAKVKVFVELYRKTQQLEQLNAELERRVAQRTAELEASTRRLIQSETRRNLALVAGQMGSWDWDMVGGDCLCDDGVRRILGLGPEQHLDEAAARKAIHPEDWERIRASFNGITPESHALQMEFRVVRSDGRLRWCLGSTAASFDDEGGSLVRLSGVVVDITDRKEAEERNALLAREVDHRARNTLTIVQSILRLTREPDVDRYVRAVEGRIRSLSQAHTLLAQSRWQGADLRKLVAEEIAAYRTSSSHVVTESGPDVLLDAPTAQTIALALHELVTNAAKHGALSAPNGQVEIAWELAGGELALSWSENGGPRPKPPTTRGFGLNVIHASIEGQLGGRVELDWSERGLRCQVTFPFGGSSSQPVPDPVEPEKAEVFVQAKPAPGTRVLLVEDEAMVAMLVKDALDELGMEMDGPFTTLTTALAAAQTTDASAALLDVNLAGEFVYPAADVLRARGIPIVFTTGYGGEDVDERYGDVPVLTKPFQVEQLHELLLRYAGVRSLAASGAAARDTAKAVATR